MGKKATKQILRALRARGSPIKQKKIIQLLKKQQQEEGEDNEEDEQVELTNEMVDEAVEKLIRRKKLRVVDDGSSDANEANTQRRRLELVVEADETKVDVEQKDDTNSKHDKDQPFATINSSSKLL